MIPTAAGSGMQTSPRGSQVYLHVAAGLPNVSSQQNQVPQQLALLLLQSDMLTMRVMQDSAFQQAVQTGQVQAAAKAAVSLLSVKQSTCCCMNGALHSLNQHFCSLSRACTECGLYICVTSCTHAATLH